MLGRKMAARSDPPGWDDISDSSPNRVDRGGGTLRCIKLPVADLKGTSSYIVACGGAYPLGKAQALCERLALMLSPLVDQELARSSEKRHTHRVVRLVLLLLPQEREREDTDPRV